MKINNTWTAIVTPFKEDLTIDWDGLKKNVEFQLSQGITGLVPVGTTGESPTLDWEEHDQVIERVIELSKDKCSILAGTGSNSTSEAVISSKQAVKAGADAVLLVDCYYNGPSSQELRDEYYAEVASVVGNAEVVPYVIPGRSGTVLTVEDLAILASKFSNISTVKEATGDLGRMAKTRAMLGHSFSIMSGDDDLTYKMMTDHHIKADGVISVATNVVPKAIRQMVEAILSDDLTEAARLHNALAPLLGIVTVKVDNMRYLPGGDKVVVNDRYRNPLAIKTLMSGLGMPAMPCRKPLGRMSIAGVEIVRNAARKTCESNPEILQPISDFYGVDINERINNDSNWSDLAI